MKNAKTDAERFAAEFVLKLLKKRLFSSPAAFKVTLDEHLTTVKGHRSAVTGSAWRRDLEDYSDDYADDDDYEAATDEAMSTASGILPVLTEEDAALAQQLRNHAAQASTGSGVICAPQVNGTTSG
jgi:hypothetical protein